MCLWFTCLIRSVFNAMVCSGMYDECFSWSRLLKHWVFFSLCNIHRWRQGKIEVLKVKYLFVLASQFCIIYMYVWHCVCINTIWRKWNKKSILKHEELLKNGIHWILCLWDWNVLYALCEKWPKPNKLFSNTERFILAILFCLYLINSTNSHSWEQLGQQWVSLRNLSRMAAVEDAL